MRINFILKAFVCLCFSLFAGNEWDDVYRQIKDINHPTKKEMKMVQNYLNHGKRKYLNWLNTSLLGYDIGHYRYDLRAREIKVWSQEQEGYYRYVRSINTTCDDKDVCVVTYGSLNSGYHESIKKIEDHLRRIGFKGHFIYRIGGWPNMEWGSLKHIHVPYSFKLCMMKEAMNLGYQKIIWIDSAVKPLSKFNNIVRILDQDGYLLMDHGVSIAQHVTVPVKDVFHLTAEDFFNIHEVQASMFGLNTKSEKAMRFFNEAFHQLDQLGGYLSPRPEQVAFGVIAYKQNLPLNYLCSRIFTEEKLSIQEAENRYFYLLHRNH